MHDTASEDSIALLGHGVAQNRMGILFKKSPPIITDLETSQPHEE